MRQRALLPDGDYSFGTGLPFLNNTPQCVAQAVMTRLRLRTGEFFIDTEDGTPYAGQVLGHNTAATRDLALQIRILGTPGVKQIVQYVSAVDKNRAMSVLALIDTNYGKTVVNSTIL